MKNIRLLLELLITFVLFGCTSLQDKELSSQKEVIHSFFIAEDNIYAIGNLIVITLPVQNIVKLEI